MKLEGIEFSRVLLRNGDERTIAGLCNGRGPVIAIARWRNGRTASRVFVFRDLAPAVLRACEHARSGVVGRRARDGATGPSGIGLQCWSHVYPDGHGVVHFCFVRADGSRIPGLTTLDSEEIVRLQKAVQWLSDSQKKEYKHAS